MLDLGNRPLTRADAVAYKSYLNILMLYRQFSSITISDAHAFEDINGKNFVSLRRVLETPETEYNLSPEKHKAVVSLCTGALKMETRFGSGATIVLRVGSDKGDRLVVTRTANQVLKQ